MNGGVGTERREGGAQLVLLTLLTGAVRTVSLPLALASLVGEGAMAARRRSTPPCGKGACRKATAGEPDSIATMSLALRRLEAELHALDDQRLTDLAERGRDG